MQQQAIPEQFYNVYTPLITFATTLFTITPNCGYTVEYVIKLKSMTGVYYPLPTWIVNTSNLDFSLQTNDPANVSIYQISITGSISTA